MASFWLVTAVTSRRELWPVPKSYEAAGLRDAARIRRLLHYRSRTHVSSVQTVINNHADISVMAFFTTTTVIGRYSVAVSLVAPLAIIGPAVAAHLFPRIAKSERVTNIDPILKYVDIVTRVCAAAWAAVSPMLLGPIFGRSCTGLAPTIAFLCAGMVPLSLGFVLFAWWKGQDRPQRPAWAEGAAILTMALLLPSLASRYGAAGAAFVSLCVYAVSFVIVFAMYRRAMSGQQPAKPV
jgi:O-antigen/teichoic acid export membrane protein